jgi:hypothetical protein
LGDPSKSPLLATLFFRVGLPAGAGLLVLHDEPAAVPIAALRYVAATLLVGVGVVDLRHRTPHVVIATCFFLAASMFLAARLLTGHPGPVTIGVAVFFTFAEVMLLIAIGRYLREHDGPLWRRYLKAFSDFQGGSEVSDAVKKWEFVVVYLLAALLAAPGIEAWLR